MKAEEKAMPLCDKCHADVVHAICTHQKDGELIRANYCEKCYEAEDLNVVMVSYIPLHAQFLARQALRGESK